VKRLVHQGSWRSENSEARNASRHSNALQTEPLQTSHSEVLTVQAGQLAEDELDAAKHQGPAQ